MNEFEQPDASDLCLENYEVNLVSSLNKGQRHEIRSWDFRTICNGDSPVRSRALAVRSFGGLPARNTLLSP